MRGSRGEGGLWQNLILIGGGASVVGFLVAVGFHVALADGGDHHFSADAMVALNALDNDSFFAFAIPLAIMLLGAAGATLKVGVLPSGSAGRRWCSRSLASPPLASSPSA
jgi:hypothetical protein